MKECITFDDVLIVPKFSEVVSRKDVDLSVNSRLLPYIRFPILSSNMDTITGSQMACAMQNYGAQAVLHRFYSIEDNVKTLIESRIEENKNYSFPFVSIGIGDLELERAKNLIKTGANVIVIDVAHGAQQTVVEQVFKLRNIYGNNIGIVVGNFASSESLVQFLERTGDRIDAVKIGIGPGSACTTRIKTGVGYPQFSAIFEISKAIKNTGIAIIADGGMSKPADIAKAIGAGAHLVMLGSMLSGTDESPGEIVVKNENKYKKYRGSASKESYEVQGKNDSWRTAEGESFWVPYKGPVKNILQDIEGGLRSSFTYVGAKNIEEFHNKVEFVRVSNNTVIENGIRNGVK